MSILRQQASRSTAFANRKRGVMGEVPAATQCDSTSCPDDPIGGPTVQNLVKQFDAEDEKEARRLSSVQPVSPSPLSPLSLSSTPMGPSRTTSGMSVTMFHLTAESQLPLGPSTLRPLTPLSPLGLPPTGAAQHFTRNNPLAEATPAGPSILPGAPSVGFSRLRDSHAALQDDDEDESGSLLEEPYLRNNPAFEAYLDSDTTSTGSLESHACTTPRSAIQEQVAGSPWLGRVQTFIRSPVSASEERVAKSAPPTVQRGLTPELDRARRGQISSSALRSSVSRALFAPMADFGNSADSAAQCHQDAPHVQPAHERHTAPVTPCRDWSPLDDMPAAAQVRAAAAVVDRLQEGVARAAGAANAVAGHGKASPASRDVLHATAVVDRLQAGVQRQAQVLRTAQAARAAAAAGPAAAEPAPAALDAKPLSEADGRAAAKSDAAEDRTEAEGKLGKRSASLSISASGRSDTAELPAPTSGADSIIPIQPSNFAKTSGSKCPSTRSWLRSALLLCTLTALLGCGTLLLAGHHMAGSPDRLAALRSGTYGAAATSFGRCVSELQQPEDAQQEDSSAGQLGHNLALEGACMYSAVRREAVLAWAELHPTLSGHISTARSAAQQAAATLTARLSPFVDNAKVHAARATAASQIFAQRLAATAAEKCPACITAAEAAAARASGLVGSGKSVLASWAAAAGAGNLSAPEFSELYHIAASTLLRGVPCEIAAAKDSLVRFAAGAAPAWAAEAAAALHARAAAATAAWAALLERSAVAVLPEAERAAAAPPSAEAPVAEGQLASARRAAEAWLGGLLRSNSAPEAREQVDSGDVAPAPEVPTQEDSSHAPPQMVEEKFESGNDSSLPAAETQSRRQEVPGEAAESFKDAQNGSETAEVELPMTNSPCSATEHCAVEQEPTAADLASTDAEAESDYSRDHAEPSSSVDTHKVEQPQQDEMHMVAEPGEAGTFEDAQPSELGDEAEEPALQTAPSTADAPTPAEAASTTATQPVKTSEVQATKVAGQPWARFAGLLAVAVLGTAALAALAVYCLQLVLGSNPGAVQEQAAHASPESAAEAALMDLSAHAPKPVLVPSSKQEPTSKTAQHTPRGRPSKKGAASTPVARSASRAAAQHTPPHSAPSAGSASEPRMTRARSRFAEEPRRTPRATAYPGPWQE